MSLPPNWASANVGEIFDVVGGGTPSTARLDYWSGDTPWISSADISENHELMVRRYITQEAIRNSATNLVPPGSVIVVTRVGLGKVAITETPLCFSQDSQALLFNSKNFNPRYVLLYMSTAVKVFKHISRGTTINGVTKKQLAELAFRLPPRNEHDRIVEEIEKQFTRLDDAVAALKRVQANLKRYRASVLKAACEGRLVPTEDELARKEGSDYELASELLKRILSERRAKWEADQLQKMIAAGKPPTNGAWKNKYREPCAPDSSSLPSLPEGWLWVSLDQIADIQGGIQKQPKRQPKKNFYPYLRVANVYRGRLDLSEIEQMELFGDELEKLRLKKGDLLIVEGNGSPTEIGRMAIWQGEISDCVHQNHIIRARLAAGIVPEFCSAHWNSPQGSSEVMQVASSTSGLYTLSTAKVARFCLPLPPLAEQARIVEELQRRLSKIDACEHALQRQMRQALGLRHSVLKNAFSGKLVPQDPRDEPASVLLESIRTERARAQAKERTPKGTNGASSGERRRRVEKSAQRVSAGKG